MRAIIILVIFASFASCEAYKQAGRKALKDRRNEYKRYFLHQPSYRKLGSRRNSQGENSVPTPDSLQGFKNQLIKDDSIKLTALNNVEDSIKVIQVLVQLQIPLKPQVEDAAMKYLESDKFDKLMVAYIQEMDESIAKKVSNIMKTSNVWNKKISRIFTEDPVLSEAVARYLSADKETRQAVANFVHSLCKSEDKLCCKKKISPEYKDIFSTENSTELTDNITSGLDLEKNSVISAVNPIKKVSHDNPTPHNTATTEENVYTQTESPKKSDDLKSGDFDEEPSEAVQFTTRSPEKMDSGDSKSTKSSTETGYPAETPETEGETTEPESTSPQDDDAETNAVSESPTGHSTEHIDFPKNEAHLHPPGPTEITDKSEEDLDTTTNAGSPNVSNFTKSQESSEETTPCKNDCPTVNTNTKETDFNITQTTEDTDCTDSMELTTEKMDSDSELPASPTKSTSPHATTPNASQSSMGVEVSTSSPGMSPQGKRYFGKGVQKQLITPESPYLEENYNDDDPEEYYEHEDTYEYNEKDIGQQHIEPHEEDEIIPENIEIHVDPQYLEELGKEWKQNIEEEKRNNQIENNVQPAQGFEPQDNNETRDEPTDDKSKGGSQNGQAEEEGRDEDNTEQQQAKTTNAVHEKPACSCKENAKEGTDSKDVQQTTEMPHYTTEAQIGVQEKPASAGTPTEKPCKKNNSKTLVPKRRKFIKREADIEKMLLDFGNTDRNQKLIHAKRRKLNGQRRNANPKKGVNEMQAKLLSQALRRYEINRRNLENQVIKRGKTSSRRDFLRNIFQLPIYLLSALTKDIIPPKDILQLFGNLAETPTSTSAPPKRRSNKNLVPSRTNSERRLVRRSGRHGKGVGEERGMSGRRKTAQGKSPKRVNTAGPTRHPETAFRKFITPRNAMSRFWGEDNVSLKDLNQLIKLLPLVKGNSSKDKDAKGTKNQPAQLQRRGRPKNRRNFNKLPFHGHNKSFRKHSKHNNDFSKRLLKIGNARRNLRRKLAMDKEAKANQKRINELALAAYRKFLETGAFPPGHKASKKSRV